MNNRLIITMLTTAMASTFLLSGCGSEQPEEIAEKYVSLLSEADMNEVNIIVTEDVKNNLEDLRERCVNLEYKALYKETASVVIEMQKKIKDTEYNTKYEEMIKAPKKQLEKLTIEMKKELVEKYPSPKDMSKKQKDEMINQSIERFSKVVEPFIEDLFILLKIKPGHTNEVKEAIAHFFIKNRLRVKLTRRNKFMLEQGVDKVISSKNIGITPKCVARYTDFGNIEDINYLETKEISPDRASVRLELINETGKSKKVHIETEKVKDHWKVSYPYGS